MRSSAHTRWLLAGALGGLLVAGAACVLDDLQPEGKACDEDHACPAGLVCALRPVSAAERAGTCQDEASAFSCQPGALLCPAEGSGWIEECEAGGHSTRVAAVCAAPAACNPDSGACAAACSPAAPCQAASEVCDQGTRLCRPGPACDDTECAGDCVGLACVPDPSSPVTCADGTPDTSCFAVPPTAPPATPATCALGGRVSVFPLTKSNLTPGLSVRLRQGQPPWEEIATTTVTADAEEDGYYEFADVPTNQRYLLELQAGQLADLTPTVTTLHPAVELRADLCAAGQFTRALVVVEEASYRIYTSQQFPGWDERRGLLLGRVMDCGSPIREPLGGVTAGTSLPPGTPGATYYFADNPAILQPDLALQATTNRGYYAVAGLPACENAVGFRARIGATPLALGEVELLVSPGGVTLLDLPLPANRLPE